MAKRVVNRSRFSQILDLPTVDYVDFADETEDSPRDLLHPCDLPGDRGLDLNGLRLHLV